MYDFLSMQTKSQANRARESSLLSRNSKTKLDADTQGFLKSFPPNLHLNTWKETRYLGLTYLRHRKNAIDTYGKWPNGDAHSSQWSRKLGHLSGESP